MKVYPASALGVQLIINYLYIDRFVQERHNSIANTLELHLSCTNPSIWSYWISMVRRIYVEFLDPFNGIPKLHM